MELEEKTLESIWQYVRKNLSAWLVEAGAALRPAIPAVGAGEETAVAAGYSLPGSVLLERLIRIEEELRAQRNLTEARFEAVDKRFDDLIHQMDKRFEAVDKRFSSVQWVMGLGFTLMACLMAVFNFF